MTVENADHPTYHVIELTLSHILQTAADDFEIIFGKLWKFSMNKS